MSARKKILVIIIHAFIGWALCAATMGIGMAATSLSTALIIHAIAAPIFFSIISLFYFKKYNFTPPLQTAIIFVVFVILVDFFIVALIINKNLEMFQSFIGTWLPFLLIFGSTYLTGIIYNRNRPMK